MDDGWDFIRGRYLDYMVRLYEEHTDGSPLAQHLVAAAERGDTKAWLAASDDALHMHTALSDAQHGCCWELGEDGDREDLLCKKCLSLDIAWHALHEVENMTNICYEVNLWHTLEGTTNVIDDQARFEGASQGFAKPGRHRKQSA